MKNRILIIGIIIFTIIIGVVFIAVRNSNFDNTFLNEFYSQNKGNVWNGVEAFMESESYNNMSETDQIRKVKSLLKIYEKNGVIKGLQYHDDQKFFSYTHNSGEIPKGTLGGIRMRKWNSMMN